VSREQERHATSYSKAGFAPSSGSYPIKGSAIIEDGTGEQSTGERRHQVK